MSKKPSKAELAKAKKWAEAQLGTGSKKKEAVFKIKETGVKCVLGVDDIKHNETLIIKECTDCTYTLEGRCIKIMMEGCKNVNLVVNGKVLTTVAEVWKCNDCNVAINTPIKTLQLDLCHTLNVTFKNPSCLVDLIWAGVEGLKVNIAEIPDMVLETGFTALKKKHKKLSNVDQFYIRMIDGKLTEEKLIRLKNGYPSTVREKNAFDETKKKNDKAYMEHVRNLVEENPSLLGAVDGGAGATKERLRKKLEAKKKKEEKDPATLAAAEKKDKKKKDAKAARDEVEKLMKGFGGSSGKKKKGAKKGAQSGGKKKGGGKKGGKGKSGGKKKGGK